MLLFRPAKIDISDQNVSLIAVPSKAALSHINPASAGMSLDKYGVNENDKYKAVCKDIYNLVYSSKHDVNKNLMRNS